MTTTTKKKTRIIWLHDHLGVIGIPARTARALYAAADSGGIIQGDDMQRILYWADPRAHTTCTLVSALRLAGATSIVDGDGEEV